jgi:ascorbate-specific PTS system EIIC-type component UlaA
MFWNAILGIATIASLVFAIVEFIGRRKAEGMLQTQAWSSFYNLNVLLGHCCTASTSLLNNNTQQLNQSCNAALGHAQSAVPNAIKNIADIKPFKAADVDRWVQSGKITPNDRQLFMVHALE